MLVLEPLVAAHAAEMFAALSAPEIYDYLDQPAPESLDWLRERYRKLETRRSADGTEQWLNWVVRLEESGLGAGYVQATVYPDATANFAYVIGPDFWGKGIAFAACVKVIALLREDYGVKALYATADARNARSIKLLGRLGFSPLGTARYPHGSVDEGDRAFTRKLG